MGKHRGDDAAGGPARLVIVALLGVAALALIVFGLSSVLGGEDDAPQAGPGSGATEGPTPSSGHGGHAAGPSTTDAPTTTPAPAATATTEPPAAASGSAPADGEATSAPPAAEPSGPPAALADCASQTEAGDDYLAATQQAADNWEVHYQASVGLNDGSLPLEAAEANWDRTREAGPADVEAYQAATTALDDAGAACAGLAEATVPTEYQERVDSCVARAEVVAEVRTRGDAMMGDWENHLEMMRTKEEFDPEEYILMWREDVAFAPERMEPYRAAAEDLEAAPACTA